MKVTKRQLRQIIKEERQRLLEDVARPGALAKAAEDFGRSLGGYPNAASAVAAALGKSHSQEVADALMAGFNAQQSYLDDIYSASDWD
tara:strand:- start:10 stop:273 length:264 start_codon:yes stop_codon:yes gene_type:complete